MKNIKIASGRLQLAFSIIACLATSLLVTSCSNPERDFQKAEQINTEQAFNDFIDKYPGSPLVAKAKADIERNAFETAQRAASVEAYQGFLKRFATGEFAQRTRDKIEALEFSQTDKTGTIKGWEAFLQKYPQSTNAPPARQILAKLTQQRDWEASSKSNNLSAYVGFHTKYPQSDRVKVIPGVFEAEPEIVLEANPFISGFGTASHPAQATMRAGNVQLSFSGDFHVPDHVSMKVALNWNALKYIGKSTDGKSLVSGKRIPKAELIAVKKTSEYEIAGVMGDDDGTMHTWVPSD